MTGAKAALLAGEVAVRAAVEELIVGQAVMKQWQSHAEGAWGVFLIGKADACSPCVRATGGGYCGARGGMVGLGWCFFCVAVQTGKVCAGISFSCVRCFFLYI